MTHKLFLLLMVLPVHGLASGCSKPAPIETHAPEEVERAISDAQEQGNVARAASEGASKK